MLYLLAAAAPLSLSTWGALLNNFAIDRANFTGVEIGILQSLREIPGFLAFAVVFLLLVIQEQTLALVALALLGLGTALTGLFPFTVGLYCATVLMSLGFHYYQAVQDSLALQWLSKSEAPEAFGRFIAIGGFSSITAYGVTLLTWSVLDLDFIWVYAIGGCMTIGLVLFIASAFPNFKEPVQQHRHIVLRSRYWLYYALTLLSGARRQIFVVFAGFMMVEKFGYRVESIATLFLFNCVLNLYIAPLIGRLVHKWGEKRALMFEYVGLIIVFVCYAFVESPVLAAILYLVDHALFAMAIAMKTYFQKIADPADFAPTAGVAFTINHIAAVIIPVIFGFIWLKNPETVFLAGAGIACLSLLLASVVPKSPRAGNEVAFSKVWSAISARD